MAFHQPQAARPRQSTLVSSVNDDANLPTSRPFAAQVEESQEWVLFSPSQVESSTHHTRTTQTAGLSRASDLGTLNTAVRSGQPESSVLEEDPAEDAELDSLDDGLHAFREPPLQHTISNQSAGPLLPAHDGLGMFPASSGQVQDQLWQHEHYNPKRKFEGHHRRPSSIARRLETLEEYDSHVTDFKRMRIEKWQMEQSQALLEEVERETRRRRRRENAGRRSSLHHSPEPADDVFGTTPKQSDYMKSAHDNTLEQEPFWKRITRKFIHDIIGIDEPLLSVILGESLPPEAMELPPPMSSLLPTIPELSQGQLDNRSEQIPSWRDRLLQRIARELGVFVHQISPHPGAFATWSSASNQYAGMPISRTMSSSSAPAQKSSSIRPQDSTMTPNFFPTIQDPGHAASWGLEDAQIVSPSSARPSPLDSSDILRAEREYWERELDIRMVFRYLKDRFITGSSTGQDSSNYQPEGAHPHDAARRAAIIRQHHPLVARAHHRPPARLRREPASAVARLPLSTVRRPSSSCASESVKSRSMARSGSSGRNYWDLGGSVGSGSILASGGLMGTWGEV